eukprot:tig00000526_g1897.t1
MGQRTGRGAGRGFELALGLGLGARRSRPGPSAAGRGPAGAGPSAGPSDSGKRKPPNSPAAAAAAAGSDSGSGEISESDAGSRAGSPDPRDAELAEAWSKAYAAAVRLDSEASSERDGGEAAGGDELESAGSASQEGQEEDPESLPAYEKGLAVGVDVALVGRRLDANPQARAALLERVQNLGRERIRALVLVAAAVLGAYEKYRDSHGNNRKLWGYWRKEHIETKYNSILEAVGFRLELPAQRTEIYTDLKNLAETMRRFPGLCRVSGSGISPIDFLSTVPLLKTADAEGAKRVAARVSDEVRRAKGYAFDESVLELGAPAAGGEEGEGDASSSEAGG